MNIWAFGTSPYGLGLTADALWDLTEREYTALRGVWKASRSHLDRKFAEVQCMLANIYRNKDERSEPFAVEEFMPGFKPKEISPADRALMIKARIQQQAAAFNAMRQGRRKPRGGR